MRRAMNQTELKIRMGVSIILTLLGAYSCAQAQTRNIVKYIGFDVSLGVRVFTVTSDINKINDMRALHEGGGAGVIIGNDHFKAKVKAGFYYSGSNTPHTQEVYESSLQINFYPLSYFKGVEKAKLKPYLIGAISTDNIKFYGTYVDKQYEKRGYEPYLGKLTQVSGLGGIGIEYQLNNYLDFVHIFAEALYGSPLKLSSSVEEFNRTTINQFSYISFGVSFGKRR
jgi:hypothetical protein